MDPDYWVDWKVGRNRAAASDPDDYSDGAAMYDETVRADLVKTSDSSTVNAHSWGTIDIKDCVQFGSSDYQTMFEDPNPTSNSQYVVQVYFRNVDNQLSLQATSTALSFRVPTGF